MRGGVEGAVFTALQMMNRFETYFDAFYAYFTTETGQFLKN